MAVALDPDHQIARIAAAVGEPTRARMLHALLSGRARTATELALVADISPATASAHLHRLRSERLVRVAAQGKHRYYSLDNERVADLLETLHVLAGARRDAFVPSTPMRLRASRTCYDHLAGTLGVTLHDRLLALGWLATDATARADAYAVTDAGRERLASLGVDLDAARRSRRRLAFACLDWSERRPHLGGAIGAALFAVFVQRRWVTQDRDSRAVHLTALGRREMLARFGLRID